MKKLSVSSLRKVGFTAFEAEILYYVAANDIQAGTLFNGVPGHNRYGNSTQRLQVNANEEELISVTWINKEKELTINPYDYLSTRNTATHTPIKTNNNNNTTTNNNDMETTNTTNNTTTNNALGALNDLLNVYTQQGYNNAKEEFKTRENELLAQIEELKNKGTGTVISVTVDGKTTKTKTEKILDDNFADILDMVANHENIYLYGPAGSGKNVLCEELAKALGVNFYYQNTILTKFDISGYKNAGGDFEETEFYKAWTQGGLFMLDEVDNSQAEALVALNAALANGYYTFPGVGRVNAHPQFYCVAAGNTNGQGATDEYCGRYKMDESSRDRFFFVKIDYNTKIEEQIVGEHTDVLEFIHELRAITKELQLPLICGYRAITKLTKYYDKKNTKFVLDGYIFRGMQQDDINEIKSRLKGANKYTKCIKKEY